MLFCAKNVVCRVVRDAKWTESGLNISETNLRQDMSPKYVLNSVASSGISRVGIL